MASTDRRRSENIAGNFYVDTSCIDCDTCRWLAPTVFHQAGDQSAVFHQPETEAEETQALHALLSCPTASIGTVEKNARLKAIRDSFPIPVEDNVFHCGFHSEKSFGAASYLIRRPEGNILIDSPRFIPSLVRQIDAMGGIAYMYLTHQDDVADHQQFHNRFGCPRIIHKDDQTAYVGNLERVIDGHDPLELAPDLLIVPTPGHTKGHTVLLYRNKFLFSGDHLAWSVRLQQLYAFRSACWYSWQEQTESMRKILAYPFEWVLPGHGWRFHTDRETMHAQLQHCIEWMEQFHRQ
jgi:glyoxylase-like metal-dependent hydrolase (beta-lactamase superfamily II)/ferredoxin